mgnify:CR=1 FL=1
MSGWIAPIHVDVFLAVALMKAEPTDLTSDGRAGEYDRELEGTVTVLALSRDVVLKAADDGRFQDYRSIECQPLNKVHGE